MIFGDYRTLHRGTANSSPQMRPLLMNVYGREWWQDAVNYGHSFGGLDRAHGLPPWDAAAGAGALLCRVGSSPGSNMDVHAIVAGRRAVLLQQIEAATSGAHSSVPRPAAAATEAQVEANWWGLADLWENDLMSELRRREQH